jgi:hypothetical protein
MEVAGRFDDGGGTLMGEMALKVLAYIVERAAGMKFPTRKSRGKIGATDKSALTRRIDRRFLDVDQMRSAKN